MEKTIFDSPYVYKEIDENGNLVSKIKDDAPDALKKEFEKATALRDSLVYVKTYEEWLDVQKHAGDENYLRAKGYYNRNRLL